MRAIPWELQAFVTLRRKGPVTGGHLRLEIPESAVTGGWSQPSPREIPGVRRRAVSGAVIRGGAASGTAPTDQQRTRLSPFAGTDGVGFDDVRANAPTDI